MELTQEIIARMKVEDDATTEIVAFISDLFLEREIKREDRKRIWDRVRKFVELSYTTLPELVPSFPHAREQGDDLAMAERAANRAANRGNSIYEFWPRPRVDFKDSHGESSDLEVSEPEVISSPTNRDTDRAETDPEVEDFLNGHGESSGDPEFDRLLAEEEEIERRYRGEQDEEE